MRLQWRLSPSIVCHNDPVVGNIVPRGKVAVALIDSDFAGPNDPLRDLAIAAQHALVILMTSSASETAHLPSVVAECATPTVSRGEIARVSSTLSTRTWIEVGAAEKPESTPERRALWPIWKPG
jgi:thiamine kinase-like enzyme